MDTYVEMANGESRKGAGGVLSINSGVGYITIDIFIGDGESISVMLVEDAIEKFEASLAIAIQEAKEKCALEVEGF